MQSTVNLNPILNFGFEFIIYTLFNGSIAIFFPFLSYCVNNYINIDLVVKMREHEVVDHIKILKIDTSNGTYW